MTEKPTILVTGGAGYIGSHAVLALRDAGWPVVVIDNLTTGFRWAVEDGAAFEEGDIADLAFVERVLRQYDVRGIMHFAGSIIVPESVYNPLKYYRNNTANSRTLIEAAVNAACPISSSPRPPPPMACPRRARSARTSPRRRSIPMASPS